MSLVKRRQEVKIPKSKKGCWTCNARKIGCDKQLPLCNNCLRTGRSCDGYGIKVQWPETADGRRPTCEWEATARKTWEFVKFEKAGEEGEWQFLNTTYDDLQSRRSSALSRPRSFRSDGSETSIVKGLNVGFNTTDWGAEDETLLSYYQEVLFRMVTTIDDSQNGFRSVLIPRALSGQTFSSRGLRSSILALAAVHLWSRGAATKHKIRAIRLLSKSIGQEKDLATCMMLCVCDLFDGADGSWYNHLEAAKILYAQAKAMPTGGYTTYFLTTWLSYHRVLAEFSCTPEYWTCQGVIPELPSQDAQNKVIVGSIGCSMQLLETISCINQLACLISQDATQTAPSNFVAFPAFLETHLSTLQQLPGILEDDLSSRVNSTKISTTAELYCFGAMIYLHRSVLNTPSDSMPLTTLVSQSLSILQTIGVFTSPWPLFVTALEIMGDEQRIQILSALDTMQRERRIGNVGAMRGIIEAVGKQADLSPRKTRVGWKSLVDMEKRIPNFI